MQLGMIGLGKMGANMTLRLLGRAHEVVDSVEGRWTVQEAVERGVPAPVVTESLYRRFASRQDSSFANRLLAALRNQFGGHAVVRAGEAGIGAGQAAAGLTGTSR